MARSKCGVADDTVVIDSEYMQFLNPILQHLSQPRQATESLFGYGHLELSDLVKEAGEAIGIKGLTLGCLRYSGASWDRLKNFRPLDDVGKRGRRKTSRSLWRYEKHGRSITASGRPSGSGLILGRCSTSRIIS